MGALGQRVGRLGYVDGLRALAALWVLAFHTGQVVWFTNPPKGWLGLLIIGGGHYAVSLFIVLSGYSLMLPVARHGHRLPWRGGAWGFYARRARRILPPYYAALGLSLLLTLLWISGHPSDPYGQVPLPVTWRSVLVHLALLQDFSATEHASINSVYWSIAVECQIYLLFPLLILFWRRYHPAFCALVTLALSLALTNALAVTWIGRLPLYTVASVAPQYIGLFALGTAAASITVTPPSSRWLSWRAHGGWEGVAVISAGAALLSAPSERYALVDVLVGGAAAALLLASSRPSRLNPIRALLEWRPLVWVGGFSYSLYLIHAPLLQLIWQYTLAPLPLSDTATYLLLLLVGGPLIVLAAWGFYWLCERPFLNNATVVSAAARWELAQAAKSEQAAASEVSAALHLSAPD